LHLRVELVSSAQLSGWCAEERASPSGPRQPNAA